MLDLNTSAGRTSEVIRLRHRLAELGRSHSAAAILSALGHPGYGSKFAAKALLAWQENAGLSLHQVVYGMQGR